MAGGIGGCVDGTRTGIGVVMVGNGSGCAYLATSGVLSEWYFEDDPTFESRTGFGL
jgi:hypothetical protein